MLKSYFKSYLENIYLSKGKNRLSDTTIKRYLNDGLSVGECIIKKTYPEFTSLYDLDSIDEIAKYKEFLLNNVEYKEVNKIRNRMYSSALNLFFEFALGEFKFGEKADIQYFDIAEPASTYLVVSEKKYAKRDSVKVMLVLKCADYLCERDEHHQSFINRTNGRPYMEGHHLIPMSLQKEFVHNLDCYANIISLCPNCHRFFHHGNKDEIKEALKPLYDDRYERFDKSGILVDRDVFLAAAIDNVKSNVIYSYESI